MIEKLPRNHGGKHFPTKEAHVKRVFLHTTKRDSPTCESLSSLVGFCRCLYEALTRQQPFTKTANNSNNNLATDNNEFKTRIMGNAKKTTKRHPKKT
jgi:hypothetical protein